VVNPVPVNSHCRLCWMKRIK